MKNCLFLLLLTGCCCEPITGKVVQKDIIPEHTEMMFLSAPRQNNIRIPILQKIPTQYHITVKKDNQDYVLRLEKEDWDSYNINDDYPYLEKP